MLNEKIVKMLNDQVQKEFYSAYLYLGFANHFDVVGLDGFANWYYVQAQEERDHAMLFVEYLHNNGESVVFEAIQKPEFDDSTHLGILEQALKHEEYVTASIHEIYDEACEQKDFRTKEFLDWFVKEQGEEEMNANDLIDRYKLFAGSPESLYSVNKELAARVHTAPSLVLD